MLFATSWGLGCGWDHDDVGNVFEHYILVFFPSSGRLQNYTMKECDECGIQQIVTHARHALSTDLCELCVEPYSCMMMQNIEVALTLSFYASHSLATANVSCLTN